MHAGPWHKRPTAHADAASDSAQSFGGEGGTWNIAIDCLPSAATAYNENHEYWKILIFVFLGLMTQCCRS